MSKRYGIEVGDVSHNSCPTHCCPLHGCKYGYDDCPVASGTTRPEYGANNGCEQCEAKPIHDAIDRWERVVRLTESTDGFAHSSYHAALHAIRELAEEEISNLILDLGVSDPLPIEAASRLYRKVADAVHPDNPEAAERLYEAGMKGRENV
jgi:hypothetical protein